MNPLCLATIAAPDPLPQPAPTWLLWFLLTLTFFLHLLPMNFVLGGSVIAAVSAVAGREGGHPARLTGWLTRWMPVAVAATITLGVAPLLFLQVLYGRLFFTGSVLMGWFWLAVVPLLVLAYSGTYLLAFKAGALGGAARVVRWVVWLFFLAIAFLYVNNMSLMLRPQHFREMYLADARGLYLNLADPALVPRFLHMVLGAIAVAGMAVAVYGLWHRLRDAEFARWAMRRGALWFAIATALNLLAGVWWLMALPKETMTRFMGQDLLATIALAVGAVLGVGAMIMMLMAVNSAEPSGLVRGSLMSLLPTLVLMVLVRDQVRRGALEAAGFQPVPWVAPQWGNIAIFAALLVAGVLSVIWMVTALSRAK